MSIFWLQTIILLSIWKKHGIDSVASFTFCLRCFSTLFLLLKYQDLASFPLSSYAQFLSSQKNDTVKFKQKEEQLESYISDVEPFDSLF